MVQLDGTGSRDRVEIVLLLSGSFGQTKTIHYYFGTSAPADSAVDGYIRIAGSPGQWLSIDRSVAADAALKFPSDYGTLRAMQEVRLSVLSRTTGIDPTIEYSDGNSNFAWDSGESVIYDIGINHRRYDARDLVISGPTPSVGKELQDDPRIRFVDANSNSLWDNGSPAEPIILDSNNNNAYDSGEPIITGPTPVGATFFRTTSSRFDRVELYSATGNYQWIVNPGFEGSLGGWGAYDVPLAFQALTVNPHSGGYSAQGTVTNKTAYMAQSFDTTLAVESWSTFKASAFVANMTGTSPANYVDIWLGLADSNANANLAFIHYLFESGDGTVPTNSSSAVYHKVAGFGTPGSWLSVNSSLQQEVSYFGTATYTLPFHVLSVVVEISAQASATTQAYFDDFSLYGPYHPGPFQSGSATSYRYAADGRNSTYVYTASAVPNGAFYIVVPSGQSVLNITGPSGSPLQAGDSVSSPLTGRIDITDSGSFKNPPVGDWRIFTTSVDAVSQIYAEDPGTMVQTSNVDPGSTINVVSRSWDPFGNPIPSANVSITLWTTAGSLVASLGTGQTNSQGWFNVTGVALANSGTFRLQATSESSSFIGLKTFQISALYAITVSISVSTTQLTAGSTVTISGSVIPPRQGVTVTILYRPAGSSAWTTLTTVQTDNGGSYSYAWAPSEGLYQIMVSTSGAETLPADSTRAQISVAAGGGLPISLILALVGLSAAILLAIVFFFFFQRRKKSSLTPRP